MSTYCYRVTKEYKRPTDFIDIKILPFCINIDKLTDIMPYILSDFCDATVIGYEKRTNKYWCKIYEKNYCSLHIELEILRHNKEISFVKMVPIMGTDSLVDNFVSNFTESIQLYTTSSFIRGVLDGKLGLGL